MKPDTEKVLSILAAHENNAANLIAILQDVQAEYNYLSEANLTLIADALDISVSRVYSVATFYENFSLEAKGKHIIKVCAGTACHVRKSGPIYDAVYEYLGLSGKKKTSDDGLFTLETVACLGACGLAPVMTIDGEVHAKMDPETALALLEENRQRFGCRDIVVDKDVAKVSIVGAGMQSHSGVASRMFEALFEANINIRMISTSEIKISVLIAKADADRAVNAIHDAFLN